MKCGYTGIAKDKQPCSLPMDHIAHGIKCEHGGDSPLPLIGGKKEYKEGVKSCRLCPNVVKDPRYGLGKMSPKVRTDIMLVGPYTIIEPRLRLYGAWGYGYGDKNPFGSGHWLDVICGDRSVFAVNNTMCPTPSFPRSGPAPWSAKLCVQNWLLRVADFIRPRAVVALGADPYFTLKDFTGIKRTKAATLVKNITHIERVNVCGRVVCLPYPRVLMQDGWDLELAKATIDVLVGHAAEEG